MHDEHWLSVTRNEAKWIHLLADLVVQRKSPFRTIEIRFSPNREQLLCPYEPVNHDGYPWDMFEDVRGALQPQGITVVYDRHRCVSKETFEEYFPGSEPSVLD